MRTTKLLLGMLLVTAAVALVVAQSAEDLFKQARDKEVVEGDIGGAIQIYERIVREFPESRVFVARSLFQLGDCYERQNQPARAREHFQRIVDQFKDQSDLLARATARLTVASGAKTLEVKTKYFQDPFAFAISPDGKSLVYMAAIDGRSQLWLHDLDSGRARPLPGTEGGDTEDCCGGLTPFWKPDSQEIGFFTDRKLKKIDVRTLRVQTLADAPFAAGGSWSRDDTIIFSPSWTIPLASPFLTVPAKGGAVTEIKQNSTNNRTRPQFLPDGRQFLFYTNAPGAGFGSLDDPMVVNPDLGAVSAARFVAPDRLLYTTASGLFFQRLNMSALRPLGIARRVVESVAVYGTNLGIAAFSASVAGPLAYRSEVAAARQFVWRDRAGRQVGGVALSESTEPHGIRISPTGDKVMFVRFAPLGAMGPAARSQLLETASGEVRAIRTDCGFDPVWSPDGMSIACSRFNQTFPNERRNATNLATQRLDADTTSSTFVRPASRGFSWPVDWSPDGRFILYVRYDIDETGDYDLLAQPVRGGDPIPVADTAGRERNGRFSRQGSWVAYEAYEPGGRYEIYVQPFPGSSASRTKVSVNGGVHAEWSRDGKELYFLSPDNRLMAVRLTTSDGKDLKFGTPAALFQAPLPPGSEYAPSPDGRFLINMPTEDQPPLIVVSNWDKQ